MFFCFQNVVTKLRNLDFILWLGMVTQLNLFETFIIFFQRHLLASQLIFMRLCKKGLKGYSEFCNNIVFYLYFSLSFPYAIFPLLCISKWGENILQWLLLDCQIQPVLRLINFLRYFFHGKSRFPANIYVANGWQSEKSRPTVCRTINLLFSKKLIGEGGNPATLLPLWETLGHMSKGQFYIKSSNVFRTWHPYLSEFLYFCTICRCHWNMRTLKISAPNS